MTKVNAIYLITHQSTLQCFASSFARRNPDGSYDIQPAALGHALSHPYNEIIAKSGNFGMLLTNELNLADDKQRSAMNAMRSYARNTGTSDNDMTKKKQLDDDVRNRLHAAMKEYKANFLAELQTAKA